MLQKTRKGFYVLPRLARVKDLRHGFSTTAFGNMSFVWGEKDKVLANRRRFAQAVGVAPTNLVSCQQEHGKKVFTAEDASINQAERIKADGLITNQKNIALLIKIADCLPLLLVDPEKQALGLIHVGYRGVDLKIHLIALQQMKNEFGSSPANILVGLGPGICHRCYHAKIDLVGMTKSDLLAAGIPEVNFEEARACSFETRDFYSHQRSVAVGDSEKRFASILAWS